MSSFKNGMNGSRSKPLPRLRYKPRPMPELSIPRLLSFKDIDTLHRLPKGTAFRAFKRLSGQLVEGEHYYYLSAQTHRTEIEALRQAGRIYASTVNAVLLTEAGYNLLRQAL